MFRLTPLRTITRTRGDAIRRSARRARGGRRAAGTGTSQSGPDVPEEDEPELAADGLLVALHGLPGLVPVDPDRLRMQELLHLADVPAGQAEGGEQAERDRLAVA